MTGIWKVNKSFIHLTWLANEMWTSLLFTSLDWPMKGEKVFYSPHLIGLWKVNKSFIHLTWLAYERWTSLLFTSLDWPMNGEQVFYSLHLTGLWKVNKSFIHLTWLGYERWTRFLFWIHFKIHLSTFVHEVLLLVSIRTDLFAIKIEPSVSTHFTYTLVASVLLYIIDELLGVWYSK